MKSVIKNIRKMVECTGQIVRIMDLEAGRIWILLIVCMISTGLALLGPYFEKVFINVVAPEKNIPMWFAVSVSYVGVMVIRAFWMKLKEFTALKFDQYLERKGQLLIFRKIMYLQKRQSDQETIGNIMQKMTGDFKRYVSFMKTILVDFTLNIFQYVAVIILLFTNGWVMGVLGLLLTPVFAISFLAKSDKLQDYGKKISDSRGQISSFVQERVKGLDYVKTSHMEEAEIGQLEQLYFENHRLCIDELRIQIVPMMLSFLTSALIIVIVYVLGIYLIMKDLFTIGGLVSTISWIQMTAVPVNSIAMNYMNFNRTLGAIERSNTILNAVTDEEIYGRKNCSAWKNGDIELSHLFFSYEEKEVLKDISLKISQGTKCAVLGESGSGKSTLLKLLAGIYTNYRGNIRIGGVELKDMDFNSLRAKIAILSQHITVWNETIRYNLLYGVDSPDTLPDEKLEEVLRMVGLDEKLQLLPDGIETICGEDGSLFSGGERQRLSIANILLRNPDIVIFDEATSAVDSRNENRIIDYILKCFENKTVIFVTHRITTMKDMDCIYLLKEGRLIADGCHSQLMRNEEYHSLYRAVINKSEREVV